MDTIVGVKTLRQELEKFVAQVQKGKSFLVVRRSKPLFKITPFDAEEDWEEVIDFTKLRKGGVNIQDLLARL